MNDEALAAVILGAQRGNPASFQRLVDHFAGRLFGFLYRLTGSRSDAEDLMQEVFVRVVRMIRAYQHDGRFEAWLFRIAANLCRDRVRRAKRSPKQFSLDGAAEVASEEGGLARSPTDVAAQMPGPDAGLVRNEDMDALGAALAQLPEAELSFFMLLHFSQMSFKEIAEATGTPLGTALARAHRGLHRLRQLMGAADGTRTRPALSLAVGETE